MRAATHIAAGEELVHSYLQPEKMYGSERLRGTYLREGYLFDCDCPRCATPLDDARVVACRACSAGLMCMPTTRNGSCEGVQCDQCAAALTPEEVCWRET